MSDAGNKTTADQPISVRIIVRNDQLAQNWWAVALRGIAGIVFGLVALLVPGAVMLSLALLFGAYLIVDGIFGIVAAARSTQAHGPWRALLAEGVLNLVMGGIAFFLPAAAVLAFVLIVGVWAVVTGGLMLWRQRSASTSATGADGSSLGVSCRSRGAFCCSPRRLLVQLC